MADEDVEIEIVQEDDGVQEVHDVLEDREAQEVQEVVETPAGEADQGSGSENGDSNTTCMICMEEWTIGSSHRLCCLKCGHLFGRACIERWIKEKGQQAKCPTCNKPAKKVDVRDLWVKAIRASDSTELTDLQRQLEQERRMRKTEAATVFQQKMRLQLYEQDFERLKRELVDREQKLIRVEAKLDALYKLGAQNLLTEGFGDLSALDASTADQGPITINVDVKPQQLKGLFHLADKYEASPTGGCKSFALCTTSNKILLAIPTPAGQPTCFGSYGLRKYSALDSYVREFIPLHQGMITSVQMKPIGGLVLTSGQDKRVRLTSVQNNCSVQSYTCDFEPTSVSWSTHRDDQFYVGSGNCFVALFDIRNTSECIYKTSRRIAHTRLLSMASVSGEDSPEGLLVNDTKGSQFLEVSSSSDYQSEFIDRGVEHLKANQLPFDGLMGTVDFYKPSNLALITTRRSPSNPNITHNLVKFRRFETENGMQTVNCENVITFYGGRSSELLSHSRILKHPTLDDSVLVAACDDTARGIKLWDASDNTIYQTIKSQLFVRDIILYTPENTNHHLLYTLTDKGLCIYRWDYA